MMKIVGLFATFCFVFAPPILANDSENSSWMEVVPGFEEKIIGARIHSVGNIDNKGLRRIEVSIPVKDGKPIEEVIVTARKDKKSKTKKYEAKVDYIKDLDAGRTGIIILLGDETDFQLRINYIDDYSTFTQ